MFAKRFLYVSASMLCLALAYHLGSRSAVAQGGGNPPVAMASWGTGNLYVVTFNGDVYNRGGDAIWHHEGNVFSGGPTPAANSTWGQLKARYR